MKAGLSVVVWATILSLAAVPTAQLLWSATQGSHRHATLSNAESSPGGTRTLTTCSAPVPTLPMVTVLARFVPFGPAAAGRLFVFKPFVPPRA